MAKLDLIMKSSLIINMIDNLGAFRFVLVSKNNVAIISLFVCLNANYGGGLRAATIKTKQSVFPLELQMRAKYRVYLKVNNSKRSIVTTSIVCHKLNVKNENITGRVY